MPYCGNCGKKLKDDSLFCGFCGTPVEPEEVVEQVSNTQSDSSYMNVSQNTVQADFSTNFEKKPEKGKKAVKGLIVAIVILGILVLLAISFAVVIMVKGYDLSDIDSIKSDLFPTSENTEITVEETTNSETQDENEVSVIETADTAASSKASQRVDSIVKEEKWKPSSMEISVDYIDRASYGGRVFFSYEGDKLKKVSSNNYEVNIEYDSEGNCTQYYEWFWEEDGIDLYGLKNYYDENGFVIKTEHYYDSDYEIFQNDANGNHIHTDYYTLFSNETEMGIWYTDDSTYDELNRVVSSYLYSNSGGWTIDTTYYYTGTNIEPNYETWEEKYLDTLKEEKHTVNFTYEYDSMGRIIKKAEYSYNDDELDRIITINYYYDSDKQEIIVSDPVDISYLVTDITSSTIDDESYGNNYYPSQIMDGDLDTSWAEGVEGNGIGEYIEFSIPKGTVISEMVIYTGYCKSTNVFYKNGAPSVIDVYSGKDGYRINLNSASTRYAAEDYEVACDGVHVTFPSPIVSNGKLRITIVDVRDGEEWDDTNISEVVFYGSPTN